MKFIKKFEKFINEAGAAEPAVRPAEPKVKPGTKPQRPSKPAPERIDRPSYDPQPKAKVSAEDVAKRFIIEMNSEGESIEKYVK